MAKKIIFIAGGGTGGHIYPGLAIAEALTLEDPNCEVHFVGTAAGLENKIIPRDKFPLHLINIKGLKNTSPLKKLLVYLNFPLAFFQCLFLILKYRPVYVFGVGGYSSGPFVLTAAMLGRKTALFESNAIPGITNRILSYVVNISFTLFEESRKYLKSKEVLIYGFPVRGTMDASPSRENTNMRVLIFGGSQGARGINITVSQALAHLPEELRDVEFVHQTGKLDYPTYKDFYKNTANVQCMEYLDPIKKYYDWADLAVCRAGASTLSELSACGKAAILVPFPFAADDHQSKNAESLTNKKAAIMVQQKDFTPDMFVKTVLELKKNKDQIRQLEENIQQLFIPNAAQNIARKILM